MFGLIISIAFAIIGTHLFCSEVEAVSHARANADSDHPKRSLELGIEFRLVMTAIPVAIMVLLYFISKNGVVSTIIALILAVLTTLGFIYLRSNGFKLFLAYLMIFGGNNLCAMAKSGYGTGNSSVWFIVWSIIVSILFIVAIIVNLGFKFKEAVGTDEDEESDENEGRPLWNTILLWVLAIIGVIGAFWAMYALVFNLIVPHLS